MKLCANPGGRIKTQRALSARNLRRLAKKNKDVNHGSHSEQVDAKRTQEKVL